jgi:methionine-rich copper-binding protein CopC
MTRRVFISAALAAALIATASPLEAHMAFEKSEPAPDATVTAAPRALKVWFTEAPDPAVSKIEMRGPSGAVTLGGFHTMADKSMMAMVEGALPDGRYTVSWQSAGNDGHIQTGEFAFTVRKSN